MASIIIPAHNEAEVIEKSITAVLSQASADDEVIISANGCTDSTEATATRFLPRVAVLHTSCASKIVALNSGDAEAKTFPRIYADADVELMPGCLDALKEGLGSGKWLAVAPVPTMDFSKSSWAVKAYYRIWLSLPYCQEGMIGAGVYALSEEGRTRFDRFPNLISDDGFVRALFRKNERCKLPDARVLVRAPSTLGWLLKIKVRSRMGQIQLAEKYPDLKNNERKAYSRGIASVVVNPLKWPAAFIYLYVSIATRWLGKGNLKKLSSYRWEKDRSSRTGKSPN